MQDMIIEWSHVDLMQTFHDMQSEGWRIVPGSIGCGSAITSSMPVSGSVSRPHPDFGPWADPIRTPAGQLNKYEQYFWMVVEKTEDATP